MKGERPILKLKRPRRIVPEPGSPTDLLGDLRTMTPALWDADRPLPLAVGIHKQIIAIAEPKGLSRSAVRRFLDKWTSAAAYQAAMSQPDAMRYNLDGTPAEPVSEKHRRRAARRAEPATEIDPESEGAPEPVSPAARTGAAETSAEPSTEAP